MEASCWCHKEILNIGNEHFIGLTIKEWKAGVNQTKQQLHNTVNIKGEGLTCET